MAISFTIIALPARTKESVRGWFITRPYWLKIIIVLVLLFMIYEFQITELKQRINRLDDQIVKHQSLLAKIEEEREKESKPIEILDDDDYDKNRMVI